MTQPKLIFHQLFEHESSTYTYLLADSVTREAILIDPVIETLNRDMTLMEELELHLRYVLDTHVHADHITSANEIRARIGVKTAVSAASKVSCADILLQDGQELSFGAFTLRAIATPGHTDSCMTFFCEGRLFTGDALLIRGTGRTDFQQGSSERLFQSVHNKLFCFPPDTLVYPGHDYRGFTSSTIGQEKALNPRLGGNRTMADYVTIMKELKLALPKKINEAVPANMACGKTGRVDGVPEIFPAELNDHLDHYRIIDVRRVDEFVGELGHVRGAELVTLGEDLTRFLGTADREQTIAFVCRSGARSGQATAEARGQGFEKAVNMSGGMLRWNAEQRPIIRTH